EQLPPADWRTLALTGASAGVLAKKCSSGAPVGRPLPQAAAAKNDGQLEGSGILLTTQITLLIVDMTGDDVLIACTSIGWLRQDAAHHLARDRVVSRFKPRKPLPRESNGIRTFGKGLVQRPQILHAANLSKHLLCPLESWLIANANRTRQPFLQDVVIA